jgi:RimJ/RimL family protein N-acetyltransferase
MDLETSRLILRQFRESDIDAWSAICAEPEVMRYASLAGAPLSREQSANGCRLCWSIGRDMVTGCGPSRKRAPADL